MIVHSRSSRTKKQPLRQLLNDAKPLFVFVLIATATAFFILHPLGSIRCLVFLKGTVPPVQAMSAPPGVVCCSYSGQIENYKRYLLEAFGGSIVLSPAQGVPDTVMMTLASPLSPAAAHLRALTAWRQLMAMRRNYMQFKEANACVVTVCDPSGAPMVTIDHDPK